MGFQLFGFELVIKFVAAVNCQRLLPRAGVRIERVAEIMMAAIRIWIGPGGRTEQRKPQNISLGVVAVLGIVDQAEAVARVSEIRPAQRRDFILGCFPSIVARCGTLDGAVGNFERRGFARGRERKRGLQQDVRFVPVDVVRNVDPIDPGIQRYVLNKF